MLGFVVGVDITLIAQEAAPSLALLAPSWRGLLAAGVWAVGLVLVAVDWVERRGKSRRDG